MRKRANIKRKMYENRMKNVRKKFAFPSNKYILYILSYHVWLPKKK